MREHFATVPEEAAGTRLDRWLTDTLDGLSRARLQGLIAEGAVTRAGQPVTDAAVKVKAGEIYTVDIPAPTPLGIEAQAIALDVVFEDDELIVVNKPAGLVVHPAAGSPDRTLVNALLAHCGDSLRGIGGVARPGIVHRIDKDTSGLLVFTRTWAAKQELSSQFRAHTIERRYLAIVHGSPHQTTFESTLVEDRGDGLRGSIEHQVRRGHTPKGARQNAITHVEVLERFGGLSLVACRLETGRTHQIRIQLSEAGHPLAGERVYIRDYLRPLFKAPRLMLHAQTLGFTHPTTGEPVSWSIDPPDDFQRVLDTLRRGDRLSKPDDHGSQPHGPIDSARAHQEAPENGPARAPGRQPAPRNHPRPGGKATR